MATPMHVFNEIAARYGCEDTDDFFTNVLGKLPMVVCQNIFDELLVRDGEPSKPMAPRKYTTGVPVPKPE